MDFTGKKEIKHPSALPVKKKMRNSYTCITLLEAVVTLLVGTVRYAATNLKHRGFGMVDHKTVNIRYNFKGKPAESAYQFDGVDLINSVLGHLVNLHVEPTHIPAQERMENGGIRNTQRNVNLIEHGVDDVFYFDEESQEWLEIPSKWLVNA